MISLATLNYNAKKKHKKLKFHKGDKKQEVEM